MEILRYIHFTEEEDKEYDGSDKCFKVRPLLELVKQLCQKFAILTKEANVDESMIPYFGKFGNILKQRMPKKPIRSGYKVWSLNLNSGYLYSFQIYQGKGSQNIYSREFGLGPSVALSLMDTFPDGHLMRLYTDNFFTSLKLAEHLAARGHGFTGTIKANQVGNAPVPSVSNMKKEERGKIETRATRDIVLCRWLDNSVVTLISNCDKVHPVTECRRWDKKKKEYVSPSCPNNNIVKQYNAFMGGTDAMDQAISAYRIGIRNRKWYWPLFTFTIHVMIYPRCSLRYTSAYYYVRYVYF